MAELVIPGKFTDSADLVNLGQKCHICGAKQVIYFIDRPEPGFTVGAYCYPCLLAACGSTRNLGPRGWRFRIPVPMEFNLMDKLQTDLKILAPPRLYK